MSSTTVKWSYSGLKQYLNCPKQYHEVKVLRNYDINVTEQMRYGTEVHSALEDYAAAQIPLAKNYLRYKPVMDELASIDGAHYNEYRMALTVDRLVCDFNDANYWVRGIADKIIVDKDLAYVIDYKTGSNRYPDPKQLQLMSLMLFVMCWNEL
jgi:ATP-dependent exoDNAse (exonuclease V) beta subunit